MQFSSLVSLTHIDDNIVFCYFNYQPPPGSFVCSGRHDHGVLLPPRASLPMARLIAAVQQAKDASNQYLTAVMEKKKAIQLAAEPLTKRTKVDECEEIME